MGSPRQHIKFSLIDYLQGKLSSGEQNQLEREVFRDTFLADALEGFENMSVSDIEKNINDINSNLASKTKKVVKTKRAFILIQPYYYRIAASILIIIGLSISGYFIMNWINQGSKQDIAQNKEIEKEKSSALLNVEADKTEQSGKSIEQGEKQEDSAEKFASKKAMEDALVINDVAESQTTEIEITKDNSPSPVNMEFETKTERSPVNIEQPSDNEMVIAESSAKEISYDDVLSLSKRSKSSPASNVITGTVIDESGQPMIGVGVKIKGTNKGTVTNIDGEYKIEVPDRKSELEFTYVGYLVEDISVENQDKINYQMTPDQLALEEVVVVGYGTQKKSDLTGSVASVSSEDLTQNNRLGFDQALQGKVAGVSITRQNEQQNLATNSKSGSDCNYTPYPDGGFEKFEVYLANNSSLPSLAEKGKEYVVVLTLSFTEKGVVKNIKIKESPGAEYSNEAIRLINQGPFWVPAHDTNCNPIDYTMDYKLKLVAK